MGLVLLLGALGVLSLVFGGMVLSYGTKIASTRWFFAAIVSNGLWALGLASLLMISPQQSISPLPIVQAYYIAAASIAVTMLLLAITLGPRKVSLLAQLILIAPGILLAGLIIALPEFFISDIYYNGSQYIVDLSDRYLVYVAFFVLYYIATVAVLLVRRHKEESSLLRLQFTSVLYAYGVAGLLGMIFDLFLPGIGEYSLIWIGPIGTFIFIPVIYRSIVRQGLFDMRSAVTRAIAYTLTLAILAFVYIFLAYAVSILFFEGRVADGVGLSPVSVMLALVLAFIFQPIKSFFDNITNQLFYRGEYNQETFLREFGRILSYDTDLRLLLGQASAYLANSLNAEKVFFVISERGTFGPKGARRLRIPEGDIDQIEAYYRENHESPEAIVTDLVQPQDFKKILLSHQVYITLPLTLQNQIIGYLFIGEHKSSGYKARDIYALESIANELTIAVQNSLSVEEIRELNENLQRRVDEATKELRASNRQLQRLDEAKNEFISMASHQLRTPLTSIKGYLDMILEGDLGKVTATQRAVLSEAFLSSERMVTLINDFLNVSRLQTGKFLIERRESNIAEVLREQSQMLKVVAKQRDLTLRENIAKNIPTMSIDADKIRQVILNFIDNAIYYSKPGSYVDIQLIKEGNEVVFTVKDTGIGVPKSEQDGLFGKFFRASNARQRRPDGTGVGLFLAKKVITLHDGRIIFQSEENKGSTFGFALPVQKLKPQKD